MFSRLISPQLPAIEIIALDILYIEINASSRASTVKLAKTKVIAHLLTYATAFLGRHFRVTQHTSLEIQTCSVTKGRTLLSLNLVKCQGPLVSFI